MEGGPGTQKRLLPNSQQLPGDSPLFKDMSQVEPHFASCKLGEHEEEEKEDVGCLLVLLSPTL